jgi:hypothetical protein
MSLKIDFPQKIPTEGLDLEILLAEFPSGAA